MTLSNGVILRTQELTKKFGELVAVDHVNISIRRGTIHAIIGPNGAGKTTLLNLITGVLRPTEGKIFFENRDITNLPAHKRAQLGIGRSFQIPSLYSYLTILECTIIAVQAKYPHIRTSLFASIRDFPEVLHEALKVLATVGLYGKTSILVRNLTLSDKRKLELALAIAGNPKLLLLDEPTAGLSIEEIPAITRIIKKLKNSERAIVVIEHKIDVVLNLADRITVMDKGRIIAEGTPTEIVNNEIVQEVYLGEVSRA